VGLRVTNIRVFYLPNKSYMQFPAVVQFVPNAVSVKAGTGPSDIFLMSIRLNLI
jgi:hypothetical protein